MICAFGAYSAVNLPIDALPDITNVQVMINSTTGALSPEEVETGVTYPIEAELAGLPGAEEVRSLSKYGLSQVIVVFRDGTNPYFARQIVSEHLNNLSSRLPPGVSPELGPLATGLGEVLQYAVVPRSGGSLAKKSEEEQLLRLRTIQKNVIRRELKTVPGVEEVDTIGGLEREIHIDVDPRRLSSYGIDFTHLAKLLDGLGTNAGAGFFEPGNKRYILQSRGKMESIHEIRQLPLRVYALGPTAVVGDVADVREGGEPRIGAATYHGKEVVIATVMVRVGENSRTVAEAALEKLKEIQPPSDIEIIPLYSQGYLINAAIRTVMENMAAGAALVVAVLFLLLRNLRAAAIVALAIPVSMLFAAGGMSLTGVSANLMSLGAVDFGLLVDGSVVIIENIVRKLEDAGETASRVEIVVDAVSEVAQPVIAGISIILFVYMPILSLTGIEGKLFAPMAKTVLLAVFASLAVALILMPGLALLFIRPRIRHRRDSALRRLYRRIVTFTLQRKALVLGPAVVIGVLAALAFSRLGSNFIPELDEGDIVLSLKRDEDASLPSIVASQKKVEEIISKFEEVEDVYCKIGSAESNVDPNGVNLSDTFLLLKKDRRQWPLQEDGKPRRKEELVEDVCKAIREVSLSEECAPEEPIGGRFNDMLEGSRADVAVRIFGPDLDVLLELTTKAEKILKKVPGYSDLQENDLTSLRASTVYAFKPAANSLDSFGLHPLDAREDFSAALAGRTVGTYYDRDIRMPVVVRLQDGYRNSPGALGTIPVELPGGGVIPLSAVGSVQPHRQVTTIGRTNGRRYSILGVFIRDRDLQSFVDDAKTRIEKDLPMPPGYRIEWGGQFKNLVKARTRLAVIVPLTLLVIFFILMRSLKSLRQAVVIFLCIPFAATGGVLLLYVRGMSMSIPAAIGFIALTGIAILNGVVLVTFVNQLRAQGMAVREAVVEGATVRFRPVIMTAFVASLGFLPMAVSSSTGAEIQRPLATVVIGGLFTATVLTLLLLPALYQIFESYGEKNRIDKTIR